MISRRLFVLGAAALPIAAKAEVLEGLVSVPALPAVPASQLLIWRPSLVFYGFGQTIEFSDSDDIERWT